MGAIARALSFSRRSIENPATKLSDPAQWLVDAFTGGAADSGVTVSQETATRMSAFWRAVSVLSQTLASLPLFVYQKQEPRGRRKAEEHPLFNLLHLEPNPRMTSFFFRECGQAQVVVHGNGYAAIRRDGGGRTRELWPLISKNVEPKIRDGVLFYLVTLSDGSKEPWTAGDVLHIPGLSFDGIKGKSVIGAAREGLGLGLAAQKYGSIMFSRGGRVPGVIETAFPKLQPDQRKNIEESWAATVGGPDNWHKVPILDRGMTYKQIGVPPEDVQFIELRKLQVVEMARYFGVQPHKLYDLERATFSNIEHQSLEFVIDTMRPWVVRWEQELSRKLLTPQERARGLFIEFNMDGLLRGDTAARGTFYALGRQWGWLSANDVLDLENRPGIGPQGDIYLNAFNMTNAKDLLVDTEGDSSPPPPPPAPPTAPAAAPSGRDVRELAARGLRGLPMRRRIKAAERPLIEDRARQIVKRETGAIEKELKKLLGGDGRARRDLKTLRQAIDEFYSEHAAWAGQKMQPLVAHYAELINGAISDEIGSEPTTDLPPQLQKFIIDYSKRFGLREASEGRLQLLALTQDGDEEDVAEAVRGRLAEWEEKRPGKIAARESTQFMAAAAKVLYVAAGVTVWRWAANPGACPFCQSLDGKIAGIEKNFVNAGEGVDGGAGTDGPLTPSDNIGHPPLHNHCQCDVVAD